MDFGHPASLNTRDEALGCHKPSNGTLFDSASRGAAQVSSVGARFHLPFRRSTKTLVSDTRCSSQWGVITQARHTVGTK